MDNERVRVTLDAQGIAEVADAQVAWYRLAE